MKTLFKVIVEGTSSHITTKNSEQEFTSIKSALDYFWQKVEELNIDHSKTTIEDGYAYTSIIGEDYVVSLESINN